MSNNAKPEVLKRLRTIKGHIAGIERMVEDNSSCKDILIQLLAVRSSVEKAGIFILENNASNCLLSDNIPQEEKEKVDELIKSIVTFLK